MMKTLISLGQMMHEMQKERSCVILYICSDKALDKEGLDQKFTQTDDAIKRFISRRSTWSDINIFSQNILNKFNLLIEEIKLLSAYRDLILKKEIESIDSISFYSHKIIGPIIDLMIENALNDKKNNSDNVSAFSNFLYLKERIGRERALCTRGLALQSFGNDEFIDNYRFLIAEQQGYKETFMAMANTEQKACYDEHMNDLSIVRIEEMHDLLNENKPKEGYNISPKDWYDLATKKIDLMHKVEIDLINILSNKNSHPPKKETKDDGDGIFADVNSFNKSQQEFIITLSLFKGLSKGALAELFRNASVKNYKKGQLLFLEGEQPNRLYIILDGWVKLFKGNSSGEETTVQMLTSGDMIAESAVFLNAPFPISAQIAKSANVLILPASIIRESIKTNNDLAVNVLTGMSVHSQLLIQGLESIRLKSATERVGWFLLKLLLEQGRVPDMVELPYDKSLIASYLDMKPETFSRTLKKFKQKGFEIRKDSVILPKVKALCGFCDSDVAAICKIQGTPECPNPDGISSDEIVLYD